MIEADYCEVVNTINNLEYEGINQDTTLFLSNDIIDFYSEFIQKIMEYIGEDGSIHINGTYNNPSYVVIKYKDMYFSLYPMREQVPHQVMVLCAFTSLDDYNNR